MGWRTKAGTQVAVTKGRGHSGGHSPGPARWVVGPKGQRARCNVCVVMFFSFIGMQLSKETAPLLKERDGSN